VSLTGIFTPGAMRARQTIANAKNPRPVLEGMVLRRALASLKQCFGMHQCALVLRRSSGTAGSVELTLKGFLARAPPRK
jgi:hypothetical protein